MKGIILILSLLVSNITFSQIGNYFNYENLRSDTIDVLDYQIHLEITDFSKKSLNGYTIVTCSPKQNNVTRLKLDLLHYSIDSISLNNTRLKYTYNDTLVNIDLDQQFNTSDTFSVKVSYHGKSKKDPSGWGGIYFGSDYAFNLGIGFKDNPHNIGRYWFPCFDNFKERSTYSIYLTTPNHLYGSSIGTLISSTPLPNNKTEWYWKMEQTIPTYLAMFAVANYTVTHDSYNGINRTIPIELYAKPSDTINLNASFIHLKQAMSVFENLYGPYAFNKIGYTVVNFSSGAMEHAGNITYPNNSIDGLLTNESLMTHELAHQWWGNYATTLTPQDMWLNEGMASFSSNYFIEKIYGWETAKLKVKNTLFNILKKAHIDEGGYLAVSGVPHELTYGSHVYDKGALVAQNLRMLLGDENFGPALSTFLKSKAFNNMTSLEFRDYLQNISPANVNGFFNGWVFNGGFPDYKIDSIHTVSASDGYKITLTINQKLNNAPTQFTDIPIEIVIYDTLFNTETRSILVGPNKTISQITSKLNPAFISLNGNNKLCYATTDDTKILKSVGTVAFKNAMWNINIESLTDSVLIKIERHWADPDPQFNLNSQGYTLYGHQFWKVDGIWKDSFKSNGHFFYIRNTMKGYLDFSKEQNLVLLYRSSPSNNWEEYPYYKESTLENTPDGLGKISLSMILKGEYALAKSIK